MAMLSNQWVYMIYQSQLFIPCILTLTPPLYPVPTGIANDRVMSIGSAQKIKDKHTAVRRKRRVCSRKSGSHSAKRAGKARED